ncbi:MAG: hypothetical protein RPR91_05070, partial [Colwellia sp.]
MKAQSDFETLLETNQGLLGIKHDQWEITGESGQLLPGSNKETNFGLHYLDFEYRLFIEIENFPAKHFALLTLLVHQFVNGLGEREGLENVGIEFGPHNKGKSLDVEITFGVRDAVNLVEVENSPIEMNGKK